MDNLEIIYQCRNGDQRAWKNFIEMFGPLAQRIAGRYFSLETEEIDNITQNVFAKLHDGGLEQFRGKTVYEFRAYFKTIVLNETRSYLKRENRWKNRFEAFHFVMDGEDEELILSNTAIENREFPGSGPDQIAEAKETIRIIEKILESHSARERQLFILKLKGYKEKEIGDMLGIPTGSVASSFSRMMDKVKEALNKQGLDSN
jgi:RNA polymerase sigma factor (sigma-70 family)